MRKHKAILTTIAIIAAISSATSPLYLGSAKAGWVDDWVQQKTTSGASYFEGQKRGYFSAGSYSARWPSNTDQLFNIQMPRLKVGCGGIDAFAGGFDMLNFDYLVQKLQRIMQSAPAAAFDIALNVLCTECSKTIKGLESIANQLNGLQFNDCQSSKAVVATIARGFTEEGSDADTKLSKIQADWAQDSGVTSLYNEIQKRTAASGGEAQVNLQTALAGCPAKFKAIFASEGSLLKNVGTQYTFDDSHIDLMRGIVGDAIITDAGAKGYRVSYVSPCSQNTGKEYDALLNGTAWAKPLNGGAAAQCYQITDTNKDLVNYFAQILTHVANGMKNKTSVESIENVTFLQASPISPYPALKMAIAQGTEAAMIVQLANLTANAHAFAMLADLRNRISTITEQVKVVSSGTASTATCRPELIIGADSVLAEMESKTKTMYDDAYQAFNATLSQQNTLTGIVNTYKKANEDINKGLSKILKRSSVAYATR
ncbi:MAG: hypothetical protein CSYNP_03994 [Syntrophus sp. SKADARSKE-3]|nr:hypothetical protein [Syntrophus sp. SKADARSKE-3]